MILIGRAGRMGDTGRADAQVCEEEPDYRYSLANERTFLAYVRTALALDAGALAVVQLLPDVATAGWRRAAAVALAVLGLVIVLAGYRRWSLNQRAMRRGEPLPDTWLAPMLAVTVAAASAVAVLMVLL
jgi:putative membrane protein